ncbi:methyltransferase domain-containing protein [Phlebopus sp. FC_14]|nr:methyltransferase domain-containing protein [Phlebopus sp. FC_14]
MLVSALRPGTQSLIIHKIPAELCSLIDVVRDLQLQRQPTSIAPDNGINGEGRRTYGMSPKKEHEVERMSSYIHHFLNSRACSSLAHVVDVGSGQGYLSWALQNLGLHVLALDNNEIQTSGANRWKIKHTARKVKQERRKNTQGTSAEAQSAIHNHTEMKTADAMRKGSLTHRTVHISSGSLHESIMDWLLSDKIESYDDDDGVETSPDHPGPVPVMFVALHACGSLTTDILRTFLFHSRRDQGTDEPPWKPHSLIVVGCCYNLMSLSDFPLSKALCDIKPTPELPLVALHLAAQVPSQWLKSQKAASNAELAIRKVVYRALLQPILQAASQFDAEATADASRLGQGHDSQPGIGETGENRRLGKLNEESYRTWGHFLECATRKMDINLEKVASSLPEWFTDNPRRLRLESRLRVLQALRCILGPLIESLIILDRYAWLHEGLADMGDRGVDVELVNLFDQGTGSGRNVALVVRPRDDIARLAATMN